jgi:hypothetical protein
MTRTTVLRVWFIAGLVTAFAATPAIASEEYSSLNAVTGGQSGSDSYRSLNSVAGDESVASDSPTVSSAPSSLNAILAESPSRAGDSRAIGGDGYRTVNSVVGDNEPPTSLVQVRESSGFDWGDALIGALVALALTLMAFGAARLIAQQRRTTAESQA